MTYTTRCTRLGPRGWGCRVLHNHTPIVEAIAPTRALIGPTFRDLLRTLDTLGGDAFTSAARRRKYREGNACVDAKVRWYRGETT